MNILELKLHLEDGLKAIKEEEETHDIKNYEVTALINNNLTEDAPPMEIQQKANLVFDSISMRKLPTGCSFVLLQLREDLNHNTPLEALIKSLDDLMNKVPLNAPVVLKVDDKPVFLGTITGEIVLKGDENIGRLFIQFINEDHVSFSAAMTDLAKELGLGM